jgi:hypothetical protein
MDGSIVPIIAGVVAAVIGAFAAYNLTGRRERQKQIYEKRREEIKRRIEAVEELRSRAYSVTEAFNSWLRRMIEEGEDDQTSTPKHKA